MIQFKACQRCGGDLRESGDMYGDYFQCVQCGHMIDLPRPQPVVAVAVAEQRIDTAA